MQLQHSIALSILLALAAFAQVFEVADVKVNKLDQPASGDSRRAAKSPYAASP